MTKIKDIIQYLESVAPPSYQEDYDNATLIVGDRNATITNVLISLDVTEEVVSEAIQRNCNLIIAHHPIVFRGLKSLTGKTYVERTVIRAIKNDVAIYAIHTNLDNVHQGVNKKICDKIGLQDTKILAPKSDTLTKLVTFIPTDFTDKVLTAMYEAGAGNIGNYSHCSFRVNGTGTFLPNENTNPYSGEKGKLEEASEDRVEVILPTNLKHKIIGALYKSHPYEEVAHYLTTLSNENQEVGSGMIGKLKHEMEPFKFLEYLKDKMTLSCIRHTRVIDNKIKTVAVCGGAGSFLLGHAKRQNADIFITADFKYHEFFDADGSIIIADIGHYESEVFTKDLISDILSKKFTNFALNLSKTVTNPISYL